MISFNAAARNGAGDVLQRAVSGGTQQGAGRSADRAMNLFGSGGCLGNMQWGHERISDIAERIPVWGVNGKTVAAANDAARGVEEMFPTVPQFLNKTLAYHGARDGAKMPTHFALPQDKKALAVARMMSIHDSGTDFHQLAHSVPERYANPTIADALDKIHNHDAEAQTVDWLVMSHRHFDGVVAASQPGLNTALEARVAGLLLMHEFEHLVTTPNFKGLSKGLNELEEGVAHVMSQAIPAQRSFTRATGMALEMPGGLNQVYPKQTQAVLAYMDLAGMSVDTSDEYARAYQLFQGHRLEEVPVLIANKIAARHSLVQEEADAIADAIRENPQNYEGIKGWVKERTSLHRKPTP